MNSTTSPYQQTYTGRTDPSHSKQDGSEQSLYSYAGSTSINAAKDNAIEVSNAKTANNG